MQASFWKIVTVVGVIGIGVLVALEVRDRLEQQRNPAPAAFESGPDAAGGSSVSENTVTGELTASEFEQFVAGTTGGGAAQPAPAGDAADFSFDGLDLTEPDTSAAEPQSQASSDAELTNAFAAFSPAAENTATISHSAERIEQPETPSGSEDSNPFTAYAAAPDNREPTQAAEFTFPADSGPTPNVTPAGFDELPDFGDAPAFDAGSEESDTRPAGDDLPAFGSDEITIPEPSAGTDAAPPRSSAMRFFGTGSSTEGNSSPAAAPAVQSAAVPQASGADPDFGESGAMFPEDSAAGNPAAGSQDDVESLMDFLDGSEAAAPATFPSDAAAAGSPTSSGADSSSLEDLPFFTADDVSDDEPLPQFDPVSPGGQNPPSTGSEFDFGGLDEPAAPSGSAAPSSGQPADADMLPFTEDDFPQPDAGSDPGTTPPLRLPMPGPVTRPESGSPAPEPDDTFGGNMFDEDAGAASESGIPPARDSFPAPEPTRPTPTDPPADRSPNNRIPSATSVRAVSAVMRPHLTIEKRAPATASVGAPLEYSIIVRNEGQSPAYDVIVEDNIGSNVVADGARPQAEFDSRRGALIWNFSELPAGETEELRVRLTPKSEGTLDGVATVRFKAQVRSATRITSPALTLQLTGPEEVRVGDEVRYNYLLRNDGSGEARDVIVRTVLQNGLRHPEGSDLEYEIAVLAPDEERRISLSVVAAEPGEFRTVAEVSALGGMSEQASSDISVIGAQLRVDRRGPARRFVGRPATYENIISNDTRFAAERAQVVEQVPDGMEFVSAGDNGQYSPGRRTVTWSIDEIPPGRQKTLTVQLRPVAAGDQESVVTVIENADFRSQAVAVTAVEDLHNVSADISRLDGPVAVGEKFGFTISVDNRGTADATDVELIVEVPREVAVIGAGNQEVQARLISGQADQLVGKTIQYREVIRIEPQARQDFRIELQGMAPVRNALVKAQLKYRQMQEPLVVSESVTVYSDGP